TTGTLDLDFGPGRQPDVSSALARGPLPEGALRLADRGFFDLGVLQDYTDQGVFCITRVPARLVVQQGPGVAGPLAEFLGRQEGVLCEVYAKLVGQVVQQWLLVTCGGPCVAYSYPKAARRVRRQAPVLALLLPVAAEVVRILERLRQRMQKRCRTQRRGGQP